MEETSKYKKEIERTIIRDRTYQIKQDYLKDLQKLISLMDDNSSNLTYEMMCMTNSFKNYLDLLNHDFLLNIYYVINILYKLISGDTVEKIKLEGKDEDKINNVKTLLLNLKVLECQNREEYDNIMKILENVLKIEIEKDKKKEFDELYQKIKTLMELEGKDLKLNNLEPDKKFDVSFLIKSDSGKLLYVPKK